VRRRRAGPARFPSCVWRPAPRPRPSGPSRRRPRRRPGATPPPRCSQACARTCRFRAIGLHKTVCFQRSGVESTNSDAAEPCLFSITHDRYGSSSHPQQNGMLSQPQPILRCRARSEKSMHRQLFDGEHILHFWPRMSAHRRQRGEEAGVKVPQRHGIGAGCDTTKTKQILQ
jgi:hypothetical protein